MAIKYKQTLKQVREQHDALWQQFAQIHDAYARDGSKEAEFHSVGRDLVDILRDAERRLCAGMGKGKYSKYTANLADKFWDEVRNEFSQIDMVGVRVRR